MSSQTDADQNGDDEDGEEYEYESGEDEEQDVDETGNGINSRERLEAQRPSAETNSEWKKAYGEKPDPSVGSIAGKSDEERIANGQKMSEKDQHSIQVIN